MILSWSSGKDSAWALSLLQERGDVEVVALFTSLNSEFQRVAMHGVRRRLVELQAERVGLPLWVAELPWPCTNEQYESSLEAVWQRAREEGMDAVAFGDLFLADIRQYRERQLAGTGLEPLFPLWEIPTGELALDMIRGGIEATLTCVDPRCLDSSFAGRRFDESLLRDLPAGVDPCGENGEFHTFVSNGPQFSRGIDVGVGEVLQRDGFVFADIQPKGE